MNQRIGFRLSFTASALGIAALSALFVGVGCAGARSPQEKLTSSAAAIRAAEEVGAPAQPQASFHLKLARDQVARAKELIKDGDEERAQLVLMRAEADAELAIALAKESRARSEADQAMGQIQTLKQQRSP